MMMFETSRHVPKTEKHCCAFTALVLSRPFGKVIHDLAQRYNGLLAVPDFRKLEKLATKSRKAELDVRFLKKCQGFGVYPKFISFDLPIFK